MNDPRQLYLKSGIISKANGSAYIEQGNTKVISSIFGPRELIKKEDFSLDGQIFVEFKFAPFSQQTRKVYTNNEVQQQSFFIKEAIQPAIIMNKFPKSCIDIYIIVLEDDGSALSAALTCLSHALINAGVELYDIVIGANIIFNDLHYTIDPKYEEETSSLVKSKMTIGYMPSLNQISTIIQNGCIPITISQEMLQYCIESCKKLKPVILKLITNQLRENIISN